jgi:hypothetical protein
MVANSTKGKQMKQAGVIKGKRDAERITSRQRGREKNKEGTIKKSKAYKLKKGRKKETNMGMKFAPKNVDKN